MKRNTYRAKRNAYLVLFILLPMAFASITASAQQIVHVDDDASPGGDGVSWNTAYMHLQDALAAAVAGDVIRVAQGIYKPDQDESGNVTAGDRLATFQLQSGVAIEGGYRGLTGGGSPDVRDIDLFISTLNGDLADDDVADLAGFLACSSGDGNAFAPGCDAFDIDGDGDVDNADGNIDDNAYHVTVGTGTDSAAIIDGFTITAGNASAFLQNDSGGGMNNVPGSPTVTRCTFLRNSALFRGGGMFNSSATSNPAVSNCRFVENHVGEGRGGGMANFDGASPMIDQCSFTNNTTGFLDGAGLSNEFGSSPTLTNCTFTGNIAGDNGGGVFSYNQSNPTFTNCMFSRNAATSGGGMSNNGGITPILVNCTFSGNFASDSGGGVNSTSNSVPVLTNCIFWNNTDGIGASESAQINVSQAPLPVVNHSSIQGLTGAFGGTGNIGAVGDPLFVDPANDDFRLAAGSPCIDAGDNSNVPSSVTTDLDGNPRLTDDPDTPDTGDGTAPIVDMGAYEFQPDGPPIPTVSQWGMIVMGLFLLMTGTLVYGNRKTSGQTKTELV
jgi:parallel beta-helix repeat protein